MFALSNQVRAIFDDLCAGYAAALDRELLAAALAPPPLPPPPPAAAPAAAGGSAAAAQPPGGGSSAAAAAAGAAGGGSAGGAAALPLPPLPPPAPGSVPMPAYVTPEELATQLFRWLHDEEVVDAPYLQVRGGGRGKLHRGLRGVQLGGRVGARVGNCLGSCRVCGRQYVRVFSSSLSMAAMARASLPCELRRHLATAAARRNAVRPVPCCLACACLVFASRLHRRPSLRRRCRSTWQRLWAPAYPCPHTCRWAGGGVREAV
mgnify:CR=1 FL=1